MASERKALRAWVRRSAGPLLIAVLAPLLGGCTHASDHFLWADQLTDQQLAPESGGGYTVGPGDVISVQVFSHPEMSGRSRVRADGKLSIPLLGDVAAAGKEPPALARAIEEQLTTRNLAVAARATVLLEERAQLRVSVLGEVTRPGLYALDPDAGLAEALASAGGFGDFAHRDRLFVVRRLPETIRIRFTYDDIAHARGRTAAFRLRTGDVVVVE
jgi:polysaccharide export outer membrane protein